MSHPTSTAFSSLASKPPQTPSNTSSTDTSTALHSTEQPAASTDEAIRHTLLRSPSSNHYADALDAAKARGTLSPMSTSLPPLSPSTSTHPPTVTAKIESGDIRTVGNAARSTVAMAEGQTAGQDGEMGSSIGAGTVGGEAFRPGLDKMQSWSEQDMKRAMQERLLSPTEGREEGFSSRRGGGEGD